MVVSNVPVILFAIDSQGTITLAEGKGLNNLGVNHGELIGQNIFQLVQGQGFDFTNHVQRALKGEELTAVIETGKGRILETMYSPARDAEGKVSGVIGISVDITERREMERALQ